MCGKVNCEVPNYCKQEPHRGSCRNVTNMWFYNWEAKRCDVFAWSCGKHRNKFSSYEDCWNTCSEQPSQFQIDLEPNRRRGKKGRNRNRYNDNVENDENNENDENE